MMKSEPTPSDHEVLTGLVERVTYQSAENGFCVLRVKARGHRELEELLDGAERYLAGQAFELTRVEREVVMLQDFS